MWGSPGRHWAAAVVLLGCLCGIHYDVVFLGRSVLHSNYLNPIDARPLAANYGPDMVAPEEWTNRKLSQYANLRDPGATWWQWEPSTLFLARAIQTAEWPLWDPYVAAGAPAMANLVPAFFFPPYTAIVALGASVGLKNAYFLALLWCAAFFTYLFLSRHGLAWTASVAGGGLVLLSGALNQNLGSFMGQTACCLPFGAYATRVFLDRPTRVGVAGLAAGYGGISLASFPPLLVAIFGILSLYALVAIATEHRDARTRLRYAGLWTAAAALGLGLVGFYYGPVVALQVDVPQVAHFYRQAALETMPLRHWLQMLSPTVLGGVQIYAQGPFAIQLTPHIPYVGGTALLCALLARPDASARMRTLWLASSAAAALILMKLVGLPPVQWVAFLPIVNHIHMAYYFGVPLGFLLAVLAAVGIDGLLRGRVSIGATVAAVAVAVGGVEILWRVASTRGVFATPVSSYFIRDWRVAAVATVLASIAAVIACARPIPSLARQLAVGAILVVAAAEGVYNNHYPRPRRWDIFEHPAPYMRLLQSEADRGRMFSFSVPYANLNGAFEVHGVDSLMAFNPPRIFELYRRYAGAPPEVFMRQATVIPPDAVLDRANVAFVSLLKGLSSVEKTAVDRGYRRRFDDGYTVIFERPTPPRFFFSSEYRVVPPAAALAAIATAPPREIVLEAQPGFGATANQAGDPDVRVESYRRNSIALAVDAPRPGLVYASESFFPGWRARVNGADTAILPANYAFRAVPVPAGVSHVEFEYWPTGLSAGLMVSAASGLIACLLVFTGIRARGRLAA
jgi:membrane protein YfhO